MNECFDVINGANYLKALDYVDPERIGVSGISHGGYNVLLALTKHPNVFKIGINIAGIFNYESLLKWREINQPWHEDFSSLKNLIGGEPEDFPEAYYEASPKNFANNIKAPLFNFQGTGDRNVPYEQMNEIVSTLLEKEKYFEVSYYPDEPHSPRYRKSWRDIFLKIEKHLNEYLKAD